MLLVVHHMWHRLVLREFHLVRLVILLSNGHGLIDTTADPDICVSSFDYDNTVTIDNTQLSDYDTQASNQCL